MNSLTPDRLKAMYGMMVLIRKFELRMIDIFARRMKAGDFPGALHSSEGQEAIAVGVCNALEQGDYVFSTYRGHGHALARGLDLKRVVAELNGKATGVSRGYGGSMHLYAPELRFMGGNGIVGGGLPLALGTAYASVKRGDGCVTVAFFGDGGSSIGLFHESLNMAAVKKWPVIYVCENNQYAATTHVSNNCPIENIADRSKAYGIVGVVVDGNEVLKIFDVVAAAAERARQGQGPTLIECKTYRHRAHCMVIPEHRPQLERQTWQQRDPIESFGELLTKRGIAADAELSLIDDAQDMKLEEAVRFMEDSPLPDPAQLEEALYA
jgi:TPP-dependent pyruvate/acetoin dehydrogenase alpha subunit